VRFSFVMQYIIAHPHEFEQCPMCHRNIKTVDMEVHHIIPQAKGGKFGPVFRVCGSCHDMIHYLVTLDIVEKYDTVEKVVSLPSFRPYLTWIRAKTNHKIYRLGDILRRVKCGPLRG
jgi:hypothetical protein